jgi:hypothetical protein
VHKRLFLVVVALAMISAGCTTSASGQPTPAPGDGSSGTSTPPSGEPSGSSSPTVELPPRPRDISLDGLDPCTLFTKAQRTQLKTTDVESGESGSDTFKGMKECVLEVDAQEPFYDYTALAVTTEGVEAWLTGQRNVEAEPTSVQGFPAAQFKFRGSNGEGCDLAVGVAEKQNLWIQVVPYSRGMEQDELCQMARQAAEMAMSTLQTLK